MKNKLLLGFALSTGLFASAQTDPIITSWILNTNNMIGYGGLLTNVQQVQYSSANVYVSATCIPGYDIGPWTGNPNTPSNQNFVFKLTRTPQQNTGTATATPLGHIGVWTNGVSIFNAKDAFSYNNLGYWNQDAIVVEGVSFDDCLGHPAPNGEYHHHLNPTCLYFDDDSLNHSPIIGYAFDGYPIYGAYGYTNTNGTGAIKRMESSYVLRSMTTRTTLPDGTVLSAGNYGPAVSGTYPLGYYIEDYVYTAGSGDLDEHNGRFCITPEYPSGTYAYFVTIDANLDGVYPYVIGPAYYGIVPSGNTGPGSGHNTPSETVTTYTPNGIDENEITTVDIFPNPADAFISVKLSDEKNIISIELTNMLGETVLLPVVKNSGTVQQIDISAIPAGFYTLRIQTENGSLSKSIVIQ